MADIFEQAKESQAKTHAMIDNQRFQALTQPFDAGIEMSNEDMYTRWSQLPREDREWIGTNYGNKTGLSAGYYNRGAIDNFYNAYREQQAQAKTNAADAEKARIAERNAADDVYKASNGVEYNISRQFADDYKKYAGQYDYAAQQAAAAQAVLKNEKATAEQKAAAQTKLNQAQADMKAAIGGIYTSMGSGVKVGDQTLGSSWADGTTPTTLDEIVALGRAGDAGIGGEMAYNEILRRAAERQDEVYKEPEQKSWEERYYEREAQRAALDRDNANRRLGMERLGRGIGELSAIIGDMVRASEGAPVTPRDWQKYYDALTAQEKANVNNYRIRMQKLAEDQRNLYLQRKAQDAAAAKDAANKQFELGKLNLKLNADADKAKEDRDAKKRLVEMQQEGAKERANIYAQGRKAQYEAKLRKDTSSIPFNGKMYYFPRGTWNDVAKDLTGMLKEKYNVSVKALQGFEGFKNEKDLEMRLRNFLQKPEIVNNPDKEAIKKDIENMLAERSLRTQLDVMNDFDATYTYTYQSGSAGASQSTSGSAGGSKLPEVEAVNLDEQ